MLKLLLYLLGPLPSIIWLLFYLRKDHHPEPNRMVVKVFLFGVLSGFFAIILEKAFQAGYGLITASVAINSFWVIFFGGALVEEIVKWLSAKAGTYKNSELDEPFDFILYMIISALGFAALENLLVLTSQHPVLTTNKAFELMFWRFVSATFLHALCSGIFGYFLALSALKHKSRRTYFFLGLIIATALHGMYNWSIMNIGGLNKFLLPLIILIALGLWVSFGIKRLKKLKPVCELYL